jgi:hypothetical protein
LLVLPIIVEDPMFVVIRALEMDGEGILGLFNQVIAGSVLIYDTL